jgi:hypothetical protein
MCLISCARSANDVYDMHTQYRRTMTLQVSTVPAINTIETITPCACYTHVTIKLLIPVLFIMRAHMLVVADRLCVTTLGIHRRRKHHAS